MSPSKSVTASIHDDGAVLFHTVDGFLFSANRTGARIWQGLACRQPLDLIASNLSREYQIPQAMAQEHTARFLAELERLELIEPRAGT